MSDPTRIVTAAYNFEVGRQQQARTSISPLADQRTEPVHKVLSADQLIEIKQRIIDLRGVTAPETRMRMIVAVVVNHAPGVPEIVSFAESEIATLKDRGAGITRAWAVMKLHLVEKAATAIPVPYEGTKTQPVETYALRTVLGDPNELRIVNDLYGAAWIVLAVARHLSRTTRGSGKVPEKDIHKYLRDCGFTI